MASVTFDRATRIYERSDAPAVDALDLEVADGEFLVLVGPSGCGKSTSLRMLAGLEEIDSGSVLIGDRDVSELPPKERDIAMVFQNYALYPHMTVEENMGFALRLAGLGKAAVRSRVADAAQVLDLTELLGRRPKQLSGGQRQRVAMGRAIVRDPAVFLMDEPLSNLDAKLRVQTRTQIAALVKRLGTTTVYVTHDQIEAMTMGDRVAVLKGGVLQQCDAPSVLYDRPANAFVAGFIGSPAMNLVTGTAVDGGVRIGAAVLPVPRAQLSAAAAGNGQVLVGFRPEAVEVGGDDGLTVVVNVVEQLGSDAFLYTKLAHEETDDVLHPSDVVVRTEPRHVPVSGQSLRLRVREGELHVFDPVTRLRVA